MSNIYDHAHEVAKALKESDDFQGLSKLKEQVDQEDTSKKMLDDFRQKQMELQMKQMQGEQLTEADQQEFQRLADTIQLNPTIKQLLEAEQRLNETLEELMKIIVEPTKEIYGSEQ